MNTTMNFNMVSPSGHLNLVVDLDGKYRTHMIFGADHNSILDHVDVPTAISAKAAIEVLLRDIKLASATVGGVVVGRGHSRKHDER